MGFANNLTEEEQMLQAKYQKLKKKVTPSKWQSKKRITTLGFPEKGPASSEVSENRAGKTDP